MNGQYEFYDFDDIPTSLPGGVDVVGRRFVRPTKNDIRFGNVTYEFEIPGRGGGAASDEEVGLGIVKGGGNLERTAGYIQLDFKSEPLYQLHSLTYMGTGEGNSQIIATQQSGKSLSAALMKKKLTDKNTFEPKMPWNDINRLRVNLRGPGSVLWLDVTTCTRKFPTTVSAIRLGSLNRFHSLPQGTDQGRQ